MSSAEVRVSESGQGAPEPGTTLGRYRLLKKIARGGMAEVFAARSFGAHGFEKTVAIKRILPRYGNDPQFVRMMVDEAKITVLLNHPNVATILELCEQDGDYFIVMEFVPGLSLSALSRKLRDGGERLGVLEASFIVVELLQGLHAAHVQKEASGRSAHIIHRDVSPQNVLVSFDGHVKVIDFGIARAKHRLEMTEVGTIKGKLRYLAPEMIDPGRFMKSGDFDHRVDVFAAGIVLWELIAHRTLYQGDDEMVVYDTITDTDAPDLARMGMCDAALAKIVTKALTRDPEKRYLSAEDFADDLRAYVYRTDAAFTAKRIAGVMERVFPGEKTEMLALERGVLPGQQAVEESNPSASAPLPPNAAPAVPPASSSQGGGGNAAAGVVPVSPNDATRTQHVSASGPRARPSSGANNAASAPANAPSPTSAPGVAATKQMRSSDSSKRLSEAQSAREAAREQARTSNKNAIPIDDADGPAQGDVLTVMTLVSKSGDAAAGGSGKGKAEKIADFKVGAETATVSEDPHGPNPRPREASGKAPVVVRSSSSGTGRVPSAATQAGANAGKDFDETPHTEERNRVVASTSFSRRSKPSSSWNPKLIGLSAATGIGIAIIGIVAVNLSSPVDEPQPSTKLPPAVVKEPVNVQVTSSAPGAVAITLGNERPVPATFVALPGDQLEIVVKAPGYLDKSVPVSVPRDAKDVHRVDVALEQAHVPLTLKVSPADALVEVGEGVGYRPGMLVPPGVPLVVVAGKPGYATQRVEVAPVAGEPLNVVIELKREGAGSSSTGTSVKIEPKEPKEPKDKKVAVPSAKTATLVLKTKPVWGQVTIDGKVYEETTPLTVELKAGKHSVTIAHPPKGWKKTFAVTLKPGETQTKTITFE